MPAKPKFNRELPPNYATDYETRYILRLSPGIVDDPVLRHGMITTVPAYLLGRYGPSGAFGEHPWNWCKMSECQEFFREDADFAPVADPALRKQVEDLLAQLDTEKDKIRKAVQALLGSP